MNWTSGPDATLAELWRRSYGTVYPSSTLAHGIEYPGGETRNLLSTDAFLLSTPPLDKISFSHVTGGLFQIDGTFNVLETAAVYFHGLSHF
jgi:hypothetical protein